MPDSGNSVTERTEPAGVIVMVQAILTVPVVVTATGDADALRQVTHHAVIAALSDHLGAVGADLVDLSVEVVSVEPVEAG